MSFRLEVKRSAEKELSRLPREVQVRIAKALVNLADNPFPAGAKKLPGASGYRIRVGDYRILYTVDASSNSIYISAIGHRREVYR